MPNRNPAANNETGRGLPQAPAITRADFTIPSDPGIDVFVREITLAETPQARGVPLLLVHGGGPGGVASFDLSVPGYSLAADFAAAGHDT